MTHELYSSVVREIRQEENQVMGLRIHTKPDPYKSFLSAVRDMSPYSFQLSLLSAGIRAALELKLDVEQADNFLNKIVELIGHEKV